jgi:hypothetical protein
VSDELTAYDSLITQGQVTYVRVCADGEWTTRLATDWEVEFLAAAYDQAKRELSALRAERDA